MKLILLGAPGAGKGTQAEAIATRLSVPIISTGNILREAVANETEYGLKAKAFMEGGRLVPDEIIIAILKERLAQPDCAAGYILDGVPRTVAQANTLTEMGVNIDRVIEIKVDDEVIVERLSGRRTCPKCGASFHTLYNKPKTEGVCDVCGAELTTRRDDTPEIIRERLRVYHEQTEPLVQYYKKLAKLRTVDGDSSISDTTRQIFSAIEA